MRIVAISDTHTYHENVVVPYCDLLLHTGDLSFQGRTHEIESFLEWFSVQPATHKVFIAGNHDWGFQTDAAEIAYMVSKYDVTYLNETSVEIEGLKVYGSPWTPWFHDWAFNGHAPKMRVVADKIPTDVDILLTHGPPQGIMDRVARWPNPNVGCASLLEKVLAVKPKLHVFGHIHETAGTLEQDGILFVNASTCNLKYQTANKPVMILHGKDGMELVPPGWNFDTWQAALNHISEITEEED
jgi:Icc-related predicted phosphoesterase